MRQRMSVHRPSANRELVRAPVRVSSIARPSYRKTDRSGLALSVIAYFGAICIIGWFVISYGDSSEGQTDALPQVASAPVPASTVAPPTYVEEGDPFWADGAGMGDGEATAAYWTNGPNPAIPPSQDPLTRQHY